MRGVNVGDITVAQADQMLRGNLGAFDVVY